MLEATYLAALNELIDNASEIVETIRDGADLAMEPENKAALDRILVKNDGIEVQFSCGVSIEKEYVR